MQTLVNGLRQYTMHLYKALIAKGVSEPRAKAEISKILREEMESFTPSLLGELEQKLEAEEDENERYKLICRIDELRNKNGSSR